jgi:hypothetical protein
MELWYDLSHQPSCLRDRSLITPLVRRNFAQSKRVSEVDDLGIETGQFLLKPELLFGFYLTPASIEQLKKDPLVALPRRLFIGIRQGGATGSGDAQMVQFTLAASKPSDNLSERIGTAQLAEEHGHKLPQAGESSCVALGLHSFHGLLKLRSGK